MKNINTEEIVKSVINHVNTGEQLAAGVSILEIRDISKEVETLIQAAKEELKSTGDNSDLVYCKSFSDIGGLLPVPNVILENTKGEGVASIPLKIVIFEYLGEKQSIGMDYMWYVFPDYTVAKSAQDLANEE